MFVDMKCKLDNPTVHKIIAYAAFDGLMRVWQK